MIRRAILHVCIGLVLAVLAGAGNSLSAQSSTGQMEKKKPIQQTGQTCGGIAALQCPAGEACRFPFDQCNVADLAGVCVSVPATCPKQGPPICGCDDKTYSNECELLKAGVRPARRGACGHGQGNAPNTSGVCKTNADCKSDQFCEFKAETCKAPGSCIARPEICTEDVNPVCGCDNQTYSNDCKRQQAGVSLKSTGECPRASQ
ncbi:MAG TPA: Kazal-type serine protease inhibitor domain-containing protein [Thermoanaerobaculia bacterium]|jgi:hypothetical protein